MKWDKARVSYYVGIDRAANSIEDCQTRYNGGKRFLFPAKLICGDSFEVPLDEALEEDGPFDICSYQFFLHHSWSTEARVYRAMTNVSALLRPGGNFIGTIPDGNVHIKKLREVEGLAFGNSVYSVQFDEQHEDKKFKSSNPFGIKYEFHLEDVVDCPKWIVPFDVFKSMAEVYDLELIYAKNNHEFVNDDLKRPEVMELM